MYAHQRHSDFTRPTRLEVTPQSAGWHWLSFKVLALAAGVAYEHSACDCEWALVPLAGSGTVRVAGQTFSFKRKGVFEEKPRVLYVPPKHTVEVEANGDFEFALGGAPAAGVYPVCVFEPQQMKAELRGKGPALRQVVHTLAPPLPAERLIAFEVYVPGGSWSGWPPHCHDGYQGCAHLEETYYFRTRPQGGLAWHRNYRLDTDFDEFFSVSDGDLVLVTQGFHSTAATPGTDLYFLNFLAGDLYDQARATPPLDDPRHAWIKDQWRTSRMQLPCVGP